MTYVCERSMLIVRREERSLLWLGVLNGFSLRSRPTLATRSLRRSNTTDKGESGGFNPICCKNL
ncbi:bifunctional polynucleotide phosphatase/kinase [Sarcoptes scabiei]|nr:bifunctional polynucleotide phosphatase/kinase [Sarcoptes scabiei]